MTQFVFANQATATLAGAITNTSTTVSLQTGEGALFPTPTGGQAFVATFTDAATGLLDEIVWCTARSGDSLTIIRAQEGTTALSWNPGDFFNMLWTAGQATAMLQASQVPSSNVYYGADTGAVNAMVATVSPAISSLATGNIFEITPLYANTSTTVTLNVSSLGAYNVYRSDGSALIVGDIQPPPYKALLAWDGTTNKYLLLDPSTSLTLVSASMSGRVTLSSAVPVMTSAVIGAVTVYFTPYNGNTVYLWNGTVFVTMAFSEISQALSDTSHSPAAAVASSVYDLFVWSNSGVVTLSRGAAWSNSTTRGYSLNQVSGLLVNASSITNGPGAGYGTYVGTIMTDAGGATVSFNPAPAAASGGPTGGAWIGLWNNYNRRLLNVLVQDSKASWAYSTGAWRASDSSNNNRVTIVEGLSEDTVSVRFIDSGYNGSLDGAYVGIGVNSTSVQSGVSGAINSNDIDTASISFAVSEFSQAPNIGVSYYQALEYNGFSNGAFYGLGGRESVQAHQLSAQLQF